jgi:hypothetical protein
MQTIIGGTAAIAEQQALVSKINGGAQVECTHTSMVFPQIARCFIFFLCRIRSSSLEAEALRRSAILVPRVWRAAPPAQVLHVPPQPCCPDDHCRVCGRDGYRLPAYHCSTMVGPTLSPRL